MTATDSTTSVPKPTTKSGETSETKSSETSATLDLTGGAILALKGRENKRQKAIRLLVTGRIRVLRVDSNFIAAECRGDSGEVYNLLWRDERWTCSCQARTDCSHLNALWAVVAVSR